tara:strand:+ start:197 stop:595 length:399 start_codon:yes stop_codon:yes gene_type:complete
MNNYKNNRRNRFRPNGDRNFRKRNGNGIKINGDYNNNQEFKRKNPGRSNQNAGKLVDKYNELAREALSNGDKILSENYLQHADHFSRIIKSQEIAKEAIINTSKVTETNKQEKNQENLHNKENNISETKVSD